MVRWRWQSLQWSPSLEVFPPCCPVFHWRRELSYCSAALESFLRTWQELSEADYVKALCLLLAFGVIRCSAIASSYNTVKGTQCPAQTLLHMEGHMRFVFIFIAATVILFSVLAANAETPEERQACESDAFSVCGAFIPDRDKVFACMANNQARLSAPCRQVMARYSQPRRHREETASHSETTGQGE